MNKSLRNITILFGLITSIILIYMMYNFVSAFVLGIFIYYSTRPLYNKLIEKDINKTISAIIAPVLFIIPVLILLIYTLRVVTVEVRSLVIQAGDSLFSFVDAEQIEEFIDIEEIDIIYPETLLHNPVEIIQIIQSIDTSDLESYFDSILQFGVVLFSSLSELFFTLLIAFSLTFYLLRDGYILRKKLHKFVNYDKTITKYIKTVDKDLEIVFFGNILLAIFIGIIGSVSFTVLTLFFPGGNILAYPALIGILCGVTSLIPVVGMKLVYIPVTAVITAIGLIENGFVGLLFPVTFFVVALVVVDSIPDFIARPYISSRGGISTGVIFFSYVLGPLTFGWYGLFLGPLIFVIIYEFVELILPKVLLDFDL